MEETNQDGISLNDLAGFIDGEAENIESDEDEVVNEQEEEAPEQEATEEAETGESEEVEAEESETGKKIVIDGEEYDVPEQLVPMAEKLKRYEESVRSDYTKKTMEAAEIRKQALAFHEQNVQRLAFEQQNLDMLVKAQSAKERLKEYENVDWAALAEQDISLYSKHKEIRDGLREELTGIEREVGNRQMFLQQLDNKSQNEMREKTVGFIKHVVPEYFEKYDEKVVTVAENLAAKYGLTIDRQRLVQMSNDPLVILGLVELAKHQERDAKLQSKRPEVAKKIASVVTASKSQPKQGGKNQEAVKRLKASGRVEDLARLL